VKLHHSITPSVVVEQPLTECPSLKHEGLHAAYSPESRSLNNALFLSAFGRRAALTVRPFAMLAHIVPRESESISQYPFNASQVLTASSQNKFALFAARHLGAKQSKNQRIGSLANSSDGYLGCLGFEARQALEVRVERSKSRVVLILNGVDGPLRWQDLQTGGAAMRSGATLDDAVEFIVPMDDDHAG